MGRIQRRRGSARRALAARGRRLVGVVLLAVAWTTVACEPPVPEGFHEYTVIEGLRLPTAMELSPDGSVFVAEKRGVVKRFDGLDDPSPTVVADLRTNVFSGWDRGLIDLALAPGYPAEPALYVLYTYDAPPGQTAPRWGQPGADQDNCPEPPGWTDHGCVVTGRLSRLPLRGGAWTGEEQVLLHDWCQQFPSHSVGSLAFAPDGALYVSAGDGASFNFVDYGQRGDPPNPCGDPPVPVGGQQAPPSAEGGTLRSQDLRTPSDPTGLSGAILRIDPLTGRALPDNPLAGAADPNARRIVAHGFRNPYRIALRPGTDELWVGDVGWNNAEELNRTVGDDATVDNFGWPCFEGTGRLRGYDEVDLAVCEGLYAEGTSPAAARRPYWSYRHDREVTPEERCDRERGSSVSGLAFAPRDGSYPDRYDGALFVADGSRNCIWALRAGPDGRPVASTVEPFVTPAARPVELEIGPNGELWYVDHEGGTIRRIGYSGSNHPPVAAARAEPTAGDPPLTVTFDAGASSDPDPGDALTYAWDLDNDGFYDDGDTPVVTTTFTEEGLQVARVRVTDQAGASSRGLAVVTVGRSQAPLPVIEVPSDVVFRAVGDPVELSGWATDAAGTRLLPPDALTWTADLLHCPDACHRHAGVFRQDGVASTSFPLPDHEYPSALEVHLTARWEGEAATVTRRVEYLPTEVSLASEPAGVPLSAGSMTARTPFTRTLAAGGVVTLTAPATATIGGVAHTFAGWSDGGARSHEITVPSEAVTYTARYTLSAPSG